MSVMMAVRKGGVVAVAADSLWTSGWDKSHRVQPKVTVSKQAHVIMSVGPSGGRELVTQKYLLDMIEEHGDAWPDEWPLFCMSQDSDHAITKVAKADATGIIVAYKMRLFELWPNGGVFESADDVIAIGCGGDFAVGAANVLMKQYKSARYIAERACLAACNLSAGCEEPIVVETMTPVNSGAE